MAEGQGGFVIFESVLILESVSVRHRNNSCCSCCTAFRINPYNVRVQHFLIVSLSIGVMSWLIRWKPLTSAAASNDVASRVRLVETPNLDTEPNYTLTTPTILHNGPPALQNRAYLPPLRPSNTRIFPLPLRLKPLTHKPALRQCPPTARPAHSDPAQRRR